MSGNSFRLFLAILVVVIAASVFIFPSKWGHLIDKAFQRNDTEVVNKLKVENENLLEKNKESDKKVLELEEKFKKDSLSLDSAKTEYDEILKIISKKDRDIVINKEKLWNAINERKKVEENLKKIKEAPLEKKGEELIFSIKQRTEKLK